MNGYAIPATSSFVESPTVIRGFMICEPVVPTFHRDDGSHSALGGA
jgi:hypothetical protein